MITIEEIFKGATDPETQTERFHEWMKNAEDGIKQWYAINWKIPHTLFNISCKFFNYMDLQKIDWYKIYKSRDLGRWENNNKVMTWVDGKTIIR